MDRLMRRASSCLGVCVRDNGNGRGLNLGLCVSENGLGSGLNFDLGVRDNGIDSDMNFHVCGVHANGIDSDINMRDLGGSLNSCGAKGPTSVVHSEGRSTSSTVCPGLRERRAQNYVHYFVKKRTNIWYLFSPLGGPWVLHVLLWSSAELVSEEVKTRKTMSPLHLSEASVMSLTAGSCLVLLLGFDLRNIPLCVENRIPIPPFSIAG
eukprot:6322891-Amphidinium_carterae.1